MEILKVQVPQRIVVKHSKAVNVLYFPPLLASVVDNMFTSETITVKPSG